jgi:hypothetical protein
MEINKSLKKKEKASGAKWPTSAHWPTRGEQASGARTRACSLGGPAAGRPAQGARRLTDGARGQRDPPASERKAGAALTAARRRRQTAARTRSGTTRAPRPTRASRSRSRRQGE